MTTGLTAETCTACRKDSPRVTDAEISELKSFKPEWELTQVDGVPRLERTFRFKSYRKALAFTRCVGDLADAEDHHPVIVTQARSVRVT